MSLSVSASGMQVSQYQMNATAHNIANANTENFHAQSATTAEVSSANGAKVSALRTSQDTGVNLEKELTDMEQSSTVYKANAKAMSVENSTLGSILDIKA